MLFARLKQACGPLDPRGWVMLVLTLDRDGHYSGKPWRDPDQAYAELGALWRATCARLGKVYGTETRYETRVSRKGKVRVVPIRHLGNRYACVVEAHRSGWPHLNVLVWSPELADELRSEHATRMADPEIANAVALARDCWRNKEPVPHSVRELARKATLIGGELGELITRENKRGRGWGVQSTAEAARDVDAVVGYCVKLAGLHESSVGELAKVTQVPMNAKQRFRRFRSGKGFLPPRVSNPDVTGCLLRRRRAGYSPKAKWRGWHSEWEVYACNASNDPAQREPIEWACHAEHELIAEEERLLSRHGRYDALPMRHAHRGKVESYRESGERLDALLSRELAAAG